MVTHFRIKNLDRLQYLLGVEVARRDDRLILSQRKYCTDLLQDPSYLGCKLIDIPMNTNLILSTHESTSDPPMSNSEYYRHPVRKLTYLIVTHPDISFDVSVVSHYMHAL